MNAVEIEKGVNVRLITTDKFKTTTICILIRQKLKKEYATINALLANTLEMGSDKYKTLSEIKNATENMYGSVFFTQIVKKGEEQLIQFFMEIANERGKEDLLCEAMEFMREIMLNPLVENGEFKEEIVSSEKENLKRAIEARMNNKGEYAKLRCIEEMCKEEAFGIYGDGYLEDVDKITGKEMYEHYVELLATAPIDFIIVGDEKEEKLIDIIKKNFEFKRKEQEDKHECEKNEYSNRKKSQNIEENLNINQGKICIGARVDISPKGEEFYSLMVANEAFGGSSTSKLFLKVREEQSLCYYINSFIYRFKGILFIQSGVDKQNFKKVTEMVEDEISQMKKGEVTDEEFENAKLSLIKKMKGIQDYNASIIDFYVSQYMLDDEDNVEDVIKRIEKVEKNSIPEICKKIYIDTIFTLS